MTRQKLLQIVWGALIHPLYKSNIEPSDFHLPWTLQNSLNGKKKKITSLKDYKRHLEYFFAQTGKMDL